MGKQENEKSENLCTKYAMYPENRTSTRFSLNVTHNTNFLNVLELVLEVAHLTL